MGQTGQGAGEHSATGRTPLPRNNSSLRPRPAAVTPRYDLMTTPEQRDAWQREWLERRGRVYDMLTGTLATQAQGKLT